MQALTVTMVTLADPKNPSSMSTRVLSIGSTCSMYRD